MHNEPRRTETRTPEETTQAILDQIKAQQVEHCWALLAEDRDRSRADRANAEPTRRAPRQRRAA